MGFKFHTVKFIALVRVTLTSERIELTWVERWNYVSHMWAFINIPTAQQVGNLNLKWKKFRNKFCGTRCVVGLCRL